MPTMVNAWALAASVLDGTLDEDYPIMNKEKREDLSMSVEGDNPYSYYDKDGGLHLRQKEFVDGHGDVHPVRDDFKVEGVKDPSYYDYNRNDPDAKNPFTDAFDYMMGEMVVGGGNTASADTSNSYCLDDDYPSEFTTLSDNDDQIAHHIQANSPYNDGWTAEFYQKQLDKEIDRVEYKLNNEVEKQGEEKPMANYFKYHEDEILKDIEEYVSGTYRGHYTGTTHEYRNVQTIDLMASRDLAADFCQANILKYGSRYGSKDGKSKKDLLKVIHYAMLLLHFDEHYGKPSMTSGNIDHNMP